MPITLFYSYAHEDEPLRQQLEKHLSLLQRQGLILPWHDRAILPGDEWATDIDEHLNTASIILLLISPDFLASDYCYDKEMQCALARHHRGEARVIPIILRPCDWHSALFGKLQVVPHDGKAVTEWENEDKAFLAIAEELRRIIAQFTGPLLAPIDKRNRTKLLKKVRQIWIEGLLEQSLHQAAWIDLHLQEMPDALHNSWRFQVQELDQPPSPLPAGTSLVQIYDEADGELLILGEPGAGKTTLLLELARTLLERAEQSIQHPLPVVFNLSSWAEKRLSLSDWLLDELWTKYRVHRGTGITLLVTGQILALLDGLDEVGEKARAACVQAITSYYHGRLERGLTPLVVCCRSQEYADLPTRVPLLQAVSILPLSQEQIDQYLQNAGGQVDALRQALQDDVELNALARQPLMLNIFTLAYQGTALADLPEETTRERTQQAVFASYVERMLTRREHLKRWNSEQMRHTLTFLARQMSQRNMTIFSVSELGPNWLPKGRRALYRWSVVLTSILVGGLFGGVGIALVGGLSIMLLGEQGVEIKPAEAFMWSWKDLRSILGHVLIIMVNVVVSELVGMLISVLAYELSRSLTGGLGVGLVGGLGVGVSLGLSGKRLFEYSIFPRSPKVKAASSIKNSLGSTMNRLRSGGLLLFPIMFGMAFFMLFLLLGRGLIIGTAFSWLGSFATALIVFLLVGLGIVLQQFLLRFFLLWGGDLPWNRVPFLDEAARRLLLRKVGNGYIFVHRQLLDYFASLERADI